MAAIAEEQLKLSDQFEKEHMDYGAQTDQGSVRNVTPNTFVFFAIIVLLLSYIFDAAENQLCEPVDFRSRCPR